MLLKRNSYKNYKLTNRRKLLAEHVKSGKTSELGLYWEKNQDKNYEQGL
jgi:hypothetical protein